MNLHHLKSISQRRDFLQKKLGCNLSHIQAALVEEQENNIHCENLIGAVSLPLGIAGPLKINGRLKEYYIPLATTEGALVASVNRGCKAIFYSQGVEVLVKKVGATRGPVFTVHSLAQGKQFCRWLEKNLVRLDKEAKKTSSHLSLKEVRTQILADQVYCRFIYDTQEAMGMNMVTIATEKIVEYIEKITKIKCKSLAGNFDLDKKPAWLNFILGRGYQGWAEVFLEEKIINKVLKTNIKQLYEVWLAKCMLGSAVSGAIGFNSHFANIVAAFFAATGQDLAHTVEGSLGITTANITANHQLHFAVYLPSLMLGRVGGGTKLATQKEALRIISCQTAQELTEVLLGAILAGELSLLASLAQGSLVLAHQKLGR